MGTERTRGAIDVMRLSKPLRATLVAALTLLGWAGVAVGGEAGVGDVGPEGVAATVPPVADTVPVRADTLRVRSDILPIRTQALPARSDILPVRPDPLATGARSPFEDLSVRLRGLGEFGGDWSRFRPCDAATQLTCEPGLIPRLQPDFQFSLEVAGTIADRIVLDVDYDQTREFGGANRFQIHYEGRDDEILRRVEVGDVTFALPDTRFLTRGVPAGNFGVLARGEAGGLSFQSVVAQQQGSRQTREYRLGRADQGVIREDTLVVDDAEYVRGQFFFLVDPEEIRAFPHLDILGLRPDDAPGALAPGPEPVQLWRMEREPIERQQVQGYIRADAELVGEGGEIQRESGWFRHLRPDTDYYIHPSGLWIALRVPLGQNEALAVTYRTRTGVEVGDYNPERIQNEGGVPGLRLLRPTESRHQPGRPAWPYEMRQVYRLSGSDEVELETVEVGVSLGEESGGRTFVSRPGSGRLSLLRLFGLDEASPFERVDRSALFQPGTETFGETGLSGTYLIFPTLRPFLEPPPLPSVGLGSEAARDLLGNDANRRIYEAEDPFERRSGGLYRLNIELRTRSTGVASTFSLGAFGIREGSERIFLGDRMLRPGIDYLLDVEAGVVTLLQPEFLLARASSDRLQISWEQVSLFRPRPTTLVGGSAELPLGDAGSVNVLGLYQAEREILNRPRFGAEPGAAGMIGIGSNLEWALPGLGEALNRLLMNGSGEAEEARIRLDGELAISLPNPNVSGDAYLDDFDAADERTVSLLSTAWHLGSRPEFREGARDVLPEQLDVASAAQLVWQHSWIETGPTGDSVGVFEGLFPRSDIDEQISIAGSQTREPGLLLTFGDTPGQSLGEAHWRSVTTLLSSTGADLTQTEYLDFYVADGDSLTLVFDLGLVSEDAYFIDAEGRTAGIHPETGRPWGQRTLDQEADPLRGEIWNRELDRRGMWPETCMGEPGRIYPRGDPVANCLRGNGRRDTEDLNGNGVLDTEERYARYVVTLDGDSPYLVRDRNQTGTRFRLYRVPLRGPLTTYPTGPLTQADWRSVQFLRMTVAGERTGALTLARMRLVGSRWVKRSVEGTLRGIGGDTLALAGSFEVTPVGVLTEGAAYQAPPGVLERLDDPASAVGGRGVEFSERSLALRFDDILPGDRVEVFSRFLQRPRDFLAYRELRLWTATRRGMWSAADAPEFFLKVGSDPDNFYLWRGSLAPERDPSGVTPEDWIPEAVIDFETWITLRRRAEERLIREGPAAGDGPIIEWNADSTHAVVLRDRARAPNLAAVREISLGVWNRSGAPVDGEVWVNELRLGGGVRTAGSARFMTLELDGGDLLQARIGYEGTSPWFRSMETRPDYHEENALNMSGAVQLGGVLPEEWAVDLPLSVSHHRSGTDPLFLQGTDLQAGELLNLRTASLRDTRAALTLRSDATTGLSPLDHALAGLEFRMAVERTEGRTLTTESTAMGVETGLAFQLQPASRTTDVVPGFLEPLVRILLPPGMARRLNEAEFQWTPEEVTVGSNLRRRAFRITRYDQIIEQEVFDPGTVESAPESWLESRVRLAFRPGGTVTAGVELDSQRDLLDPGIGVLDPRVRPLVEADRRQLMGIGLGWETRRSLLLRAGARPELVTGVRGDLSALNRFSTDRNARLVRLAPGDTLITDGPGGGSIPGIPTPIDPDEPFEGSVLLRNVRVERDLRGGLTIDPGQALPGAAENPVFSRLSPVNVTLQSGLISGFFREDVDPGMGLQTGFVQSGGFRVLDGVRASTLVDRRALGVGTGIRLPSAFFVNLNLQNTRLRALDQRSAREARTRSWPDLRLGTSAAPIPEGLRGRISRIAFTSGVQRVRESVHFGEGLQERTRVDLRVPSEITVELVGGFTTRLRSTVVVGDGRDPTGTTERFNQDHGISLETRFRPSGGLETRLDEPFRLAFIAQYTAQDECRIPSGRDECVPFIDQVNRSLGLTLDTVVSGFEVGGQASLVDRRTFTGFESGFTQLQVGIWGRMEFTAGSMDPFTPADPAPFGG
jgi:hypothetical protein